ncbi:hypothetical protein DFH09DRAFT_518688 [Mycena vulgaris]|nr:hypothetical protein DFH09DRAFT_518688 [Mycena vulgaris]
MLANIYGFALYLILAISVASAATPTIVLPAKGSVIAPNATFPFSYHSISDYGTSSYNYTVWLFTSPPRHVVERREISAECASYRFFEPTETFATGYHFGRFSQPNYPGNAFPHNLPPPTFTMPDFSKLGGGWGVGAPATRAKFYFAVIEEYADELPSVGFRMSLAFNEIIYNGTHH